MSIKPLWRLMRPHQWLKNGFVLAALVFARHLLEFSYVSRAAIAVTAFCLASSAVYVFNDIIDREQKTEIKVKEFFHFRELYMWFLVPSLLLLGLELFLSATFFRRIP